MVKFKSALILIVSFAVSALFVVSCSTSSKKNVRIKKERKGYTTPKDFKDPQIKLTELKGMNVGLVAIDQNQFVYSSRLRDAHNHAQLYRFNRNTEKEARVTFSDGNSHFANWVPRKQLLFYASDTDEAKERSEFIAKNIDPISAANEIPADRSEIYSSDIIGNKINRITRSPGFDGDHNYHPQKELLAFISKRDSNKDIYLYLPNTRGVQRITQTKEEESSPRFSPNGKDLAWIEYSPKEKTSLIFGWPGRKREVLLSLKDEPIEGLIWAGDSDTLLFTTRLANGVHQVFEYKISSKCLKRLTFSDNSTEFPALVGDQLFYLVKKDGKSFLGQSDYKVESACIDVSVDPLITKEGV